VVQRFFSLPKRMLAHRDLIAISVKRDLEARFSGTMLGWLWPLVHPMFLFVVYYFIFTKLLNFKIPHLPEGQESALGIFMFCGIMSYATISEGVVRGANTFIENGNLIKKLAFPAEILPLNISLVCSVTHLFALAVFLLGCLLTPIWEAPGLSALWIPLILAVQLVFIYGFALLLSTLQVFLRDTVQVVGIVMTVWMFVTPIFWVPELMGESIQPYIAIIYNNPLYHLVSAWRGALMGDLFIEAWTEGDQVLGPYAPVSTAAIGGHLAIFAIWAVALYGVGYAFFTLSERRFADEV
jgi:ABC-type polysaccharide/polyol phosphate export permease